MLRRSLTPVASAFVRKPQFGQATTASMLRQFHISVTPLRLNDIQAPTQIPVHDPLHNMRIVRTDLKECSSILQNAKTLTRKLELENKKLNEATAAIASIIHEPKIELVPTSITTILKFKNAVSKNALLQYGKSLDESGLSGYLFHHLAIDGVYETKIELKHSIDDILAKLSKPEDNCAPRPRM